MVDWDTFAADWDSAETAGTPGPIAPEIPPETDLDLYDFQQPSQTPEPTPSSFFDDEERRRMEEEQDAARQEAERKRQETQSLMDMFAQQERARGEPPRTPPEAKRVDEPVEAFDPDGSGYDYGVAKAAGYKPDKQGHWPSVVELKQEEATEAGVPAGSFLMLKGKQHPTWDKAVKAEHKRGYVVVTGNDGRKYSVPAVGQYATEDLYTKGFTEAVSDFWRGKNVGYDAPGLGMLNELNPIAAQQLMWHKAEASERLAGGIEWYRNFLKGLSNTAEEDRRIFEDKYKRGVVGRQLLREDPTLIEGLKEPELIADNFGSSKTLQMMEGTGGSRYSFFPKEWDDERIARFLMDQDRNFIRERQLQERAGRSWAAKTWDVPTQMPRYMMLMSKFMRPLQLVETMVRYRGRRAPTVEVDARGDISWTPTTESKLTSAFKAGAGFGLEMAIEHYTDKLMGKLWEPMRKTRLVNHIRTWGANKAQSSKVADFTFKMLKSLSGTGTTDSKLNKWSKLVGWSGMPVEAFEELVEGWKAASLNEYNDSADWFDRMAKATADWTESLIYLVPGLMLSTGGHVAPFMAAHAIQTRADRVRARDNIRKAYQANGIELPKRDAMDLVDALRDVKDTERDVAERAYEEATRDYETARRRGPIGLLLKPDREAMNAAVRGQLEAKKQLAAVQEREAKERAKLIDEFADAHIPEGHAERQALRAALQAEGITSAAHIRSEISALRDEGDVGRLKAKLRRLHAGDGAVTEQAMTRPEDVQQSRRDLAQAAVNAAADVEEGESPDYSTPVYLALYSPALTDDGVRELAKRLEVPEDRIEDLLRARDMGRLGDALAEVQVEMGIPEADALQDEKSVSTIEGFIRDIADGKLNEAVGEEVPGAEARAQQAVRAPEARRIPGREPGAREEGIPEDSERRVAERRRLVETLDEATPDSVTVRETPDGNLEWVPETGAPIPVRQVDEITFATDRERENVARSIIGDDGGKTFTHPDDGKPVVIPKTYEEFRLLSPTEQDRILSSYSPAGYYDANERAITISKASWETPRVHLEELFHASFARLDQPERAAVIEKYGDEEAAYGSNAYQTGNFAEDIADQALRKIKEGKVFETPAEVANEVVNPEDHSVAPSYSVRTWDQDVQDAIIVKADIDGVAPPGVTQRYLRQLNNVAARIMADPERLDFIPAENDSALKPNSDPHYKKSVDFSTLCKKRLVMMGTMEQVQLALNRALLPDEILQLRQMLMDAGEVVTCGPCYVESKRMFLGPDINELMERYPDIPSVMFLTQDGAMQLRETNLEAFKELRKIYSKYKAKIPAARTEYRGEILIRFRNRPDLVAVYNERSGLRWQSWSDFEVPHMLDSMQVITDMWTVGLKGHAYTKVPIFADIFGSTGLMINMSLIPKGETGMDSRGRLIFDDREGMPFRDAMRLRKKYPRTVGTVAIGANAEHVRKLLADPRIDYVIPYHSSGLSIARRTEMGMPWDDFTAVQNPVVVDWDKNAKYGGKWHEQAKKRQPALPDDSEWFKLTDSMEKNQSRYVKLCRRMGLRPQFEDYSHDKNYWKLLIDRRTVDDQGDVIEQEPVKPIFNMTAAYRELGRYAAGEGTLRSNDAVVQQAVEAFSEPTDMEGQAARAQANLDREKQYAIKRREADREATEEEIAFIPKRPNLESGRYTYDANAWGRKYSGNEAVANAAIAQREEVIAEGERMMANLSELSREEQTEVFRMANMPQWYREGLEMLHGVAPTIPAEPDPEPALTIEQFTNKGDDFWGIKYDEEEGASVFTDTGYAGTQCTGYAAAIRKMRGPSVEIMGFSVDENPDSAIADMADGHDFALLYGRFIVDPWLSEVESGRITTRTGEVIDVQGQVVFDLFSWDDHDKIVKLYGLPTKWTRMTEVEKIADEAAAQAGKQFAVRRRTTPTSANPDKEAELVKRAVAPDLQTSVGIVTSGGEVVLREQGATEEEISQTLHEDVFGTPAIFTAQARFRVLPDRIEFSDVKDDEAAAAVQRYFEDQGIRFMEPDRLAGDGSVFRIRKAFEPAERQYAVAPRDTGMQILSGGTTVIITRRHPDFKQAKAGDVDAAERVIRDVVRPRRLIQNAAESIGPDAMVVPVHAEEAAGRNKLPVALAAEIAKEAGAELGTDIIQVVQAKHTGADAISRLIREPEFVGPVESGKRYLIVDDHVTLGGTVRALARHITDNGGIVVGVAAMSQNAGGLDLRPSDELIRDVDNRLGDVLRTELNHEASDYTRPELQYLSRFKTPDALRARIAQARSEIRREEADAEQEVAQLPLPLAPGQAPIQERQYAVAFRSALRDAIADMPLRQAIPGDQFANKVQGLPNVKKQEMEESGFFDWLQHMSETGQSVTKDSALAFLDQNGVRIEEVRKGDTLPLTPEGAQAIRQLADLGVTVDSTGGPDVALEYRYTIPDEYGGAPEVSDWWETDDLYRHFANQMPLEPRMQEWWNKVYPLMQQADAAWEKTAGGRYEEYAPPGGVPGTYHEVLITVPTREPYAGYSSDVARIRQLSSKMATVEGLTKEESAEYKEATTRVDTADQFKPRGYTSPHWYEPNVIAHMLMDERRIPLDILEKTQPELAARLRAQGKTEARALHMIEGQSDLHQQGAAMGYVEPPPAPITELPDDVEVLKVDESDWRTRAGTPWVVRRRVGGMPVGNSGATRDEAIQNALASFNEAAAIEKRFGRAPALPFRGDAWKRLVLRKMLAEAADGGYDLLTWSTGEDRFKQWGSQRVDWVLKESTLGSEQGELKRTPVEWEVAAVEQTGGEHEGFDIGELARERGALLETYGRKVRTKEDLRDVIEAIGRGDATNVDKLTDRIWERMQTDPEQGTSLPRKEFFEFMYDTSFRNEASKILRKMDKGARVFDTSWYTEDVAVGPGEQFASGDVHAIPITPAVKEAVAQGQPMYAVERIRAPEEVRYAVDQREMATPDDVPAKAATPPAIWRSTLYEVSSQKLPGSVTGPQLISLLDTWARKGQLKKAELDESGILDWAREQRGKLSKEDVLSELEQRTIPLQEVLKEMPDRKVALESLGEPVRYTSDQWEEFENVSDVSADFLRDGDTAAVLWYPTVHGYIEELPDGRYMLVIGREEYIEPLPNLEARLLDWAISEDMAEVPARDAAGLARLRSQQESILTAIQDLGYVPNVTVGDPGEMSTLSVRDPDTGDYLSMQGEAVPADLIELSRDWERIERERVEASQPAAIPRYANYQAPGGSNYREMLLTLPVGKTPDIRDLSQWELEETQEVGRGHKIHTYIHPSGEYLEVDEYADMRGGRRLNEFASHLHDAPDLFQTLIMENIEQRVAAGGRGAPTGEYQSGHWDEPNVLVHIRFNERTGPNGEKVLFIEEIQSDWHQQGRRSGYQSEVEPDDEIDALRDEMNAQNLQFIGGELYDVTGMSPITLSRASAIFVAPMLTDPAYQEERAEFVAAAKKPTPEQVELHRRLVAAYERIGKAKQAVPDAPLKKNWHEVALKRMMRWAVDNGFDAVAWTTGETQNQRYNLATYIDEIGYHQPTPGTYVLQMLKDGAKVMDRTVPDAELERFVGKDIAQRIRDRKGKKRRGIPMWILSGLDLQVGGEGMIGFYDRILPAFANKYTKKWGGKVTDEQLGAPDVEWQDLEEGPFDTIDDAREFKAAEVGNPNARIVQTPEGLYTIEVPAEPTQDRRVRTWRVLDEEGNVYAEGLTETEAKRIEEENFGVGFTAELDVSVPTPSPVPSQAIDAHVLPITDTMREAISKEAQPLYAVRRRDANIDRARLAELGTTTDLREAGYIMPNGTLVDLSGKAEGGQPGTRSYDHREAGGNAGMQEYMAEGNIRINGDQGAIDIVTEPTPSQYDVIRKIIERTGPENVYIDLQDGLGPFNPATEYYRDPERSETIEPSVMATPASIIGKIRRFFEAPDRRYAALRHGTPHTFDAEPGFPHGRFRLDKIGTGEGAQAIAWGIYLAQTQGVAANYRLAGWVPDEAVRMPDGRILVGKQRTAPDADGESYAIEAITRWNGDVRKAYEWLESDWGLDGDAKDWIDENLNGVDSVEIVPNTGNVYTLDLPDDVMPKLLDWDTPIQQQAAAKNITVSVERNDEDFPSEKYVVWVEIGGQKRSVNAFRLKRDAVAYADGLTGEDLYRGLTPSMGPRNAAMWLNDAGIPGVKYLDQQSRASASDTVSEPKLIQRMGEDMWTVWVGSPSNYWTFNTQKQAADFAAERRAAIEADQTRNYVIWDQSTLDRIVMLERNGEKLDEMLYAVRRRRAEEGRIQTAQEGLPPPLPGEARREELPPRVPVEMSPEERESRMVEFERAYQKRRQREQKAIQEELRRKDRLEAMSEKREAIREANEKAAFEKELLREKIKDVRAQRDKKLAEKQAEKVAVQERMRQTWDDRQARRELIWEYAKQHLDAGDREAVLSMIKKANPTDLDMDRAIARIDELEQTYARAKQQSRVKKLMRIARRRLKARSGRQVVLAEYAEPLRAIIDDLDPSKPSEQMEQRLEATKRFFDEHPELREDLPPRVQAKIERLQKRPLATLTMDELVETEAAILTLLKQNDLKGKLLRKRRWRDIDQAARDIIRRMQTHRRRGGTLLTRAPMEPGAAPERTAAGRMLVDWYDDIDLMTRIMDAEEDGPANDLFYGELNRAEAQRLQDIQEMKAAFRAGLKERNADIGTELYKMSDVLPGAAEIQQITVPAVKDERGVTVMPEHTLRMTSGQKISFLLTAMDPDGRRSLLESNENEILRTQGEKLLRRERVARIPLGKMTEADIQAVRDSLTPEERGVLEAAHEFFNVISKEMINQTSRALEGYDIARQENYFPKITVREFVRRGQTGALPGRSFMQQTLEDLGILKERQPAAKAPVLIKDIFQVLEEHMAKISAYHAYAVPLRQIKSVFNWVGKDAAGNAVSMENEMRKAYGDDWVRNLKELIGRVESQSHQLDPFEHAMEWLRGRTVGAILTMRPTVWAKQAISYPLAAMELGYGNMAKALKLTGLRGEAAEIADKVVAESPEIQNRLVHGRVSRDIGDYLGRHFMLDLLADDKPSTEKLAVGVRVGDQMAIRRVALASYYKAQEELGPGASEDQLMERSRYWLERAIKRTQPAWHLKDLTVMGGSPSVAKRWFYTFRTFRDKVIKMQRLALLRYTESDRSRKAKLELARDLSYINIVAFLLAALVNEIWGKIRGRKRKREQEKTTVDWAVDLGLRTTDNALGNWFLVGDAANVMVRQLAKKRGYKGDVLRSPVVETMNDILSLGGDYVKALQYKAAGDEEKFENAMFQAVKLSNQTIGRAIGIPLEGFWDVAETVTGGRQD